ncbi:G-rich sequence factor 1 isoform X2 [Epinephelus fuscoguttatus]|uniref:G-rich sequence factor 1 isoform X2 n=1 Tax=Epinephelus fuscoguttatus TaxID=293821 RepID=UPI0020D0BF5E|nr:G-rich sequence factor 1 isoform X2 [Epinephelus fuscoguttatus]
MSRHSKSLLFLLQRCVAVRQITLPTGIRTRCSSSSLSPGRCGFIQQQSWTSTPRAVCQLQSAVRISQYRFCTKAETPCDDEYPPLPAYQSDAESEKKEVYIMQVRGLPWSCSAQDLLQFFSECRIRDGVNGIHLTVDKMGRPNGQAFIEMEHEEDVCKALEKHRQYLGPRYVEVYEVTNNDAEAILKKVIPAGPDVGVVRLRGLPFSCNKADIAQFFSGLEIEHNGITIVLDHKGRNSGEAFVQFSSKTAADEALKRDRQLIGNRYIEVFPSRLDEIRFSWRQKTRSTSLQMGVHQSASRGAVPASQTKYALSGHYIHMRGLPFQVSGEDIVQFFSPLVVSKILIECSPEGKPSGEADIYFTCHEDALTAMSRDRMHLGGRYIELFLNSAPDFDERR